MKKILSGVLLIFLFIFLVACTAENDTPEATNTNTENSQANNATVADVEADQAEEEFDESSLLNPAYNMLEELITNTISTESVSYNTSTEEITYYISQDDSVNENYQEYRDTIFGFLDRENAYTDLYRSYTHTVPIADGASMDLIDSFEGHTKTYFNSIYGKYRNVISDNMWYKEELPSNYKTIDHLADIISIYLANYEYVVIEEITDSEDSDFGKTILSLEAPNDIFIDNLVNLSMNFFNGYYYPSEEYELDALADPSLLKYVYAGLIVNENSQVSAFYFSYSTPLEFGTEEDYYSFFTRTDFFDYNMTTVEDIPEEGFINAVEY